jgi:hypothetical protein
MWAVFETVEARKVQGRQPENGLSNEKILEIYLWKDTLPE